MIATEKKILSKIYVAAVLFGGAFLLGYSLYRLPLERVDIYFLPLAACTIFLGSRITVQIPRFKAHISVSDTFIFLTLIVFGAELAVLLSAVEAFFAARRFCRKVSTVLLNSASMAISTSAAAAALTLTGYFADNRMSAGNVKELVIALSTIALVQFFVNTALAALYDAVDGGAPLIETWTHKYLWTFFTYFAGALGAGALDRAAEYAGYGVLIAALPVILLTFLSYRMSVKNVQMSIEQAEQAERYAATLEKQSSALRESEQRFRSAFNHAPIGIALVSAEGKWIKVNRALCAILGYSAEEFKHMDLQAVIFPEDLGDTLVKIHEVRSGKAANCQMEQRYLHKSGRTVWTSWSVSAAGELRSENSNLIFQIQDITEKKLFEEQLRHEATHDALTGLPNRAYFMSRLSKALKKARRDPKYRVSVLFIDLDRFKYVNDSLGHLIGDQLLIGISQRLRQCMRPPDIVARLGGDEFTILVEGRYYQEKVTQIADRIQSKFNEPFNLNGHEVYSSASIGILHASERHQTSEDMMRDADTAMYQAKRAGKARHATFDENMHLAAKEILQLETDLRRAVEKEEITVVYQPIFELATGRVEGVEALTRWNHPQRGEVPVEKFINIAEEIGIIGALGNHIMRRACGEMGSLLRELPGGDTLTLSVNLSCRQFGQPDLVENVATILAETRFRATQLKFEITESIFFEYQEKAVTMLDQIRDLGIAIDIDDFGTGYSNLGYLARLPLSTLKIDRSFVSPITDDGANTEIVRTIVAMAGNLGLKTVAEGIETPAQLAALKALNCYGGQGYLFARPMTFEGIAEYFREISLPAIPKPQFDDVPILSTVQ